MTKPHWTPGKLALVVLPIGLLTLLAVSVGDPRTTQQLFVNTTYYFLMVALLCWVGVYLHAARDLRRENVVAWVKENWPGLIVALAVTAVAGLSVEPALRVLSDEANLVGTSKNLFASKTATFTVSGKHYYESFWDVDVAIDRRPTLFPFLVSLVHAVCGYSHQNAFVLNLLLLPAFVLVAYRFAKSLGGETFAVVASLFAVAHPVTLLAVRSAGFDFLATFLGLLVVKSALDYTRDRSASKLAMLWMNSCLLAEVRYESALFIVPVLALLFAFKLVTWNTLRPYALVYALTPAFLLPRIWQSILRGNVPEQESGAVTFSVQNFFANAREYFEPIWSPFGSYPAHSAALIALGVVGCLLWLRWLFARVRAGAFQGADPGFALFVAAWMLLQAVIVWSYVWGRAQYPSAARLVMAIDTFFSFMAAWAITRALERRSTLAAVLLAVATFVMGLPGPAQERMMNRLTQTRESAKTWSFFERLSEKRILVVTDRPNHFTIMDYGAMNFESARRDPYLFTAFARHLFHDVYVIQHIKLSTNQPWPGYEIWPDRKLDTVLEFQNDADVLVRISRLVR